LLVAEEVRRGHPERAIPWLGTSGETGDLTFLAPLVTAWAAAERGAMNQAINTLDQVQPNSLLAPLAPEERAFILLKFKRSADAEPFARTAVGKAGAREQRLRLALADGFLAAGDKARALMIIEGMGSGEAAARQRINAGRSSGQSIDTLPKALAEILTAFSADLARLQRSAPPIGLAAAVFRTIARCCAASAAKPRRNRSRRRPMRRRAAASRRRSIPIRLVRAATTCRTIICSPIWC